MSRRGSGFNGMDTAENSIGADTAGADGIGADIAGADGIGADTAGADGSEVCLGSAAEDGRQTCQGNGAELSSLDDNFLVELSRGDDRVLGRQAVSELVSRYLGLVRKKACAFAHGYAEPEDLAQEGFLAFLNAINSFDTGRGTRFSSFAEVCVTNGVKNAARRLGAGNESFGNDPEESGSDGFTPESIWFEKESIKSIYSGISSVLSKKEWDIFRLYLGGLSYREIAERLDIPVKSVDNAVFRVRKKLKEFLSRDSGGV